MSGGNLLQRSHSGERGASAILVAASLLLLMGFAAIAVDAGIAFSERRQQTSAADVGALAALQFAKTTLGTPSPECNGLSDENLAACRGAVEALDVIEGTLPGRYVTADWDNCQDPDDDTLGYTQDSHVSDCISFTSSLQRSRVVLPGTEVDTAFSRPIGFDFINVGAFAEAGLEMDISGGVLPFALGPAAGSSNQACFFTQDTPNLDVYPCSGPTQGNFGKLDIRWYGNEGYNLGGERCSGQNQWRMAVNIIVGADHPMEPHTKNPGTIINDVSNCNTITNPVDEIETWTGNAASGIANGLFNGEGGLEGRLICKQGNEGYPAHTYTSDGNCVEVNNNHPGPLDHKPLWAFLDWNNGDCNGGISDRAAMEDCLAHYKATNPVDSDGDPIPLFTSDLVSSTRFGAVPELHDNPGNGSGAYLITRFKPVFLETLYLKCGGDDCDVAHSPGEDSTGDCPEPITPADSSCGWNSSGNKGVEALTAFILTLEMLPADIADNFPYQDGTLVYNLYK